MTEKMQEDESLNTDAHKNLQHVDLSKMCKEEKHVSEGSMFLDDGFLHDVGQQGQSTEKKIQQDGVKQHPNGQKEKEGMEEEEEEEERKLASSVLNKTNMPIKSWTDEEHQNFLGLMQRYFIEDVSADSKDKRVRRRWVGWDTIQQKHSEAGWHRSTRALKCRWIRFKPGAKHAAADPQESSRAALWIAEEQEGAAYDKQDRPTKSNDWSDKEVKSMTTVAQEKLRATSDDAISDEQVDQQHKLGISMDMRNLKEHQEAKVFYGSTELNEDYPKVIKRTSSAAFSTPTSESSDDEDDNKATTSYVHSVKKPRKSPYPDSTLSNATTTPGEYAQQQLDVFEQNIKAAQAKKKVHDFAVNAHNNRMCDIEKQTSEMQASYDVEVARVLQKLELKHRLEQKPLTDEYEACREKREHSRQEVDKLENDITLNEKRRAAWQAVLDLE